MLAALCFPLLISTNALGATALPLHFHPLAIGWDWWLPTNYAVHGRSMDLLFIWIFWITTVVFVGVQAALIYFMVKYRHRDVDRKAIFIHGNTTLEMIWTIIPTIILIGVALATRTVWENYRYNPNRNDPSRAQIMVIGQQFIWNVVYPGPDGQLGRYLIFPKTTDLKWPDVPEGKTFEFPSLPGPAFMPEEKARLVLNQYIDQVNPLGKDFSDPLGKDDDWQDALGRPVEIPKGRLVDVHLGSKDVIHDFFLPNFRVKLDAVPGMKGHVYFTATASSKEFEDLTHKRYLLDELDKQMVGDEDWVAVIPPSTAHAYHERQGARQWLFRDDQKNTIVRNGATFSGLKDPDTQKKVTDLLREIGVTELEAYKPKHWDLVCEELCGLGHWKMQDNVIVLEDAAYQEKWGPKPAAAAAMSEAPTSTPPSTPPPDAANAPKTAPSTSTSTTLPTTEPAGTSTTAPSTLPATLPVPSTEPITGPTTSPATQPAIAPATAPATGPSVPTPSASPATTMPATLPYITAPASGPTTQPTSLPASAATAPNVPTPTTEPTTGPATSPVAPVPTTLPMTLPEKASAPTTEPLAPATAPATVPATAPATP